MIGLKHSSFCNLWADGNWKYIWGIVPTFHPQELEGENFQVTHGFSFLFQVNLSQLQLLQNSEFPAMMVVFFSKSFQTSAKSLHVSPDPLKGSKRFNCCYPINPITCFEKTSDVQVIIGVLLAAAFYFRQPGPEEQALRQVEVEIPVTWWRFKSPGLVFFGNSSLL